jgi:FeS assembly protein IscX
MNIEKINWSNIDEIVDNLMDECPEVQNREYVENLNFVTLKQLILNLEDFDDCGSCNEKKLEAIQQLLIDETVGE